MHPLDEHAPYCLTSGRIPLDHFFLIDDCICCWFLVPDMEGISPFIIEDNTEASRCINFLRSTGRCFANRTEVIEYAKNRNWPMWAEVEKNERDRRSF